MAIIENPNKRGHRLTQGESATWEESGLSIIESLINFMEQRGRNLYTNYNPHKVLYSLNPNTGEYYKKTVTTPKGNVISRPLLPGRGPVLTDELEGSLLEMILKSRNKEPLPELQPLSKIMKDRL